jgi:dihydroorotase
MLITITRPDDWHLHLRDGAALRAVLPHSARQFARAIVMPNLRPPMTTVAAAEAYRARILDALPPGMSFAPLMTLYLTDNTPADEIRRAVEHPDVHAVKLYPAGATTNSDSGVTDVDKCDAVLATMEELGMPLLVHGEATDPAIDVFDREKVFIERVLQLLLDALSASQGRFRAHHDQRCRRVCRCLWSERRGDDHRASPALQPQRHFCWRRAPALLLPAGSQA